MTTRGWLLFAAMCVIWGIPYLLIKVAVRQLSPADLVLGRTAISALLLLPLALSRGQVRPVLARWRPVLAFSAVEIAIPWVLLSRAEQRLSSSMTGLLIAAVPLVGALVARLSGSRERLDGRRLGGLLLGLVGVASLVGLDVHGTSMLAVGEVGIVAVGYAIGPLILSRHLSDLPGLGVIAVSLAVCAVAYAPFAAATAPAALPSAKVLGSVLALAVVCTALAFLLFFELIAEVGPIRATVITYVNPAVAALLGVSLLGETFTAGMGVGFALVLAGSIVATRPTRRLPAAAEPAGAVESTG